MRQVLWTPQARADLDDIALSIAIEGSLEASDQFINELTEALTLYATQPQFRQGPTRTQQRFPEPPS